MTDKLQRALKKIGLKTGPAHLPRHIAVSVSGNNLWAKSRNVTLKQGFSKGLTRISELIRLQVELNIPVITFYVLSNRAHKSENFPILVDCLSEYFSKLSRDETVFHNKVKISFLGKWYNLPGRVVDPIKKVIEETKDYDSFFVNFCINYHGHEEILDACKLIGRKLLAGKVDIDSVTQEDIKESLYSSYFPPPELMIETAGKKFLNGFLLWDSIKSVTYFSNKLWPDYTQSDLLGAIKYYQEWKK